MTHTSAIAMAKGALQKRSVRIAGHRTSIALEVEFWDALTQIATQRGLSLPRLLAEIDAAREKDESEASLASAVRVFVLKNRL
ncbi:MAG TPA: ribbon-helix-helix domain-containing protein [Caulobacterales bacterium]|nr:ribbon-helix-helix domain-containing protein [Caulobacterales bacterium]